ncbi:MAG: hypothetical protein HOA16_12360, partial [Opitutae bacterium]|nr:hypothetical protein [Opitutae bacterium]
ENGRKIGESTYKDGKKDGLQMFWYENGQKGMEAVSANGKLVTYRAWKLNGEKCPVTNFKDGNGVTVFYNPEDGTEFRRITHKDGEPISD